MIIETTLNDMLEQAKRNMIEADVIRTFDEETSAQLFTAITKNDIVAKGRIRPRGASSFAQRANMLQTLSSFANSALSQDPAINTHISGKKMALMVERLLDLEQYDIVRDNVRIDEQMETQRLVNAGSEVLEAEQMTPAGPTDEAPI
jgi:nitrogenase subunit NifH